MGLRNAPMHISVVFNDYVTISLANELRWFISRWCIPENIDFKAMVKCMVVCSCLPAAITTTDVLIYESCDILLLSGKNSQGKLNCNLGLIYNSGCFNS